MIQYVYGIQTLSLSLSKLHTYLNTLSFFFSFRHASRQATLCAMNINVKWESIPSVNYQRQFPALHIQTLSLHSNAYGFALLASLLSTSAVQRNMLQRLLCSDVVNVSWFNLYSFSHYRTSMSCK